jgi:hypothetical protein
MKEMAELKVTMIPSSSVPTAYVETIVSGPLPEKSSDTAPADAAAATDGGAAGGGGAGSGAAD